MEEELVLDDISNGTEYEPLLPIDLEDNQETVIGDYKTVETLQKDAAPAPPVDPVPPADTEEDTFTPPTDETDWTEKGKTDYKDFLAFVQEDGGNIKDANDYQLYQDRFSFLNHHINNDPQLNSLVTLKESADDELLSYELRDKFSRFEDDEEIEARRLKYYNAEGEMTEKGKKIVEETKTSIQNLVNQRLYDLNASALEYAKQNSDYRQNINNYIPDFSIDTPDFEVGNNKVKVEVKPLNKSQRYKLGQFITSGEYGKKTQDDKTGEGYKNKVANAFWLNDELRGTYLENLAKQAYEKGQSDYAAKHILK